MLTGKYKLIAQISLTIISVILVLLIYNGIRRPIKFKYEVEKRREVVIRKLKDIRNAQIMYRNVHGRYISNFDTLIEFINEGQIPIIKLTADPDDTTFTIMFIDTVGYRLVKDSIFKNRDDLKTAELKYIPFSGGAEFDMRAGTTVRGNVNVNVVEVFAANKYFLKGLDLKKNNIDPKEGLRFGSMQEPTTDGNWE